MTGSAGAVEWFETDLQAWTERLCGAFEQGERGRGSAGFEPLTR
ncbi:hypothetical protein [Streptomyces sp900116325]